MQPSPGPGCHHLRGGSTAMRHVAGVLAVGAAFDVEDRRLVRQRTSPTAAPSPGTDACALRRIVGWSNTCRRRSARRRSARSRPPRRHQVAGHLQPEHERRASAVVQIEHPIRFHAKAMRHSAAAAVERHVRQLGVGDQDVDVRDGVLTVAFDQTLPRPAPPCRWRSRPRPRGGGTSAPGTSRCRAGRRSRRTARSSRRRSAPRADTSRHQAG